MLTRPPSPRSFALALLVALSVATMSVGCSPFTHSLRRDGGAAKPVTGVPVLEPFGEEAALQMYSSTAGNTTTYWKDKPPLAQPDSLRALSSATAKAGAQYGIVATAEMPDSGDILLLRPVILEQRETDSNSLLQVLLLVGGAACLCPPMWLGNVIVPLKRTEVIRIGIVAFRVPAAEARARVMNGGVGTYLRTDGLLPVGSQEIVIHHTAEGGFFGSNQAGGDPLMQDIGAQVAKALAEWVRVEQQAAPSVSGRTS